jgi:hypothetical protein
MLYKSQKTPQQQQQQFQQQQQSLQLQQRSPIACSAAALAVGSVPVVASSVASVPVAVSMSGNKRTMDALLVAGTIFALNQNGSDVNVTGASSSSRREQHENGNHQPHRAEGSESGKEDGGNKRRKMEEKKKLEEKIPQVKRQQVQVGDVGDRGDNDDDAGGDNGGAAAADTMKIVKQSMPQFMPPPPQPQSFPPQKLTLKTAVVNEVTSPTTTTTTTVSNTTTATTTTTATATTAVQSKTVIDVSAWKAFSGCWSGSNNNNNNTQSIGSICSSDNLRVRLLHNNMPVNLSIPRNQLNLASIQTMSKSKLGLPELAKITFKTCGNKSLSDDAGCVMLKDGETLMVFVSSATITSSSLPSSSSSFKVNGGI